MKCYIVILAAICISWTEGAAQPAACCNTFLSAQQLSTFTGQKYSAQSPVTRFPDRSCDCLYTTSVGAGSRVAGLNITVDPKRQSYKLAKTFAASPQPLSGMGEQAFLDIGPGSNGLKEMRITAYKHGKTYSAYVGLYKSEAETQRFLEGVMQRMLAQ
jgi:hypothetical protein